MHLDAAGRRDGTCPWLANIPSVLPTEWNTCCLWIVILNTPFLSSLECTLVALFDHNVDFYSFFLSFFLNMWLFCFLLWKGSVNSNVKWSFGQAVLLGEVQDCPTIRVGCCWRAGFFFFLFITSWREPQTWNKSVTFQAKEKDSKRWPNSLSLRSPCHLIAVRGAERRAGKAGNLWRKTDTFMHIRRGIFLTMQTLVDNKLFALGVWQIVWICKYYRANEEEDNEGEIRLLICSVVWRSEDVCNSAALA